VLLSTQVYKWVLMNLNVRGVARQKISIQGGVEILLVIQKLG